MRTKFRTIIPILIAVITAISVIPAYAEVIPRESLPENTPQAAVDTAEALIGATLAKVESGMGYADARVETNRIIFGAFLNNQTNGYSYGLLTIIANNAIYEYRDLYLRSEYYSNAEEIVKIMLADLIIVIDRAKQLQVSIRLFQRKPRTKNTLSHTNLLPQQQQKTHVPKQHQSQKLQLRLK